jgi:polar amino acid transport system substrate-binding protein
MGIRSVIACVAIGLAMGANARAENKPLVLCFEDVPQTPWTMPDGTGLNIELLKRVEKMLGENFQFSAKPWARCLKEVREGSMDGVFGASDTEERRHWGVFPTLPDGRADVQRALHVDSFNVFIRVGGAASWDGKELHAPGKGVLVQRGYVTADILRQRGFTVQEATTSGPDAIRQLAADMFDVAIIQGVEPGRFLRTVPSYRKKITVSKIPYELLPSYLLMGRPTYERDPKRIEAIWKTIDLVRRSPEYRAMEASALH